MGAVYEKIDSFTIKITLWKSIIKERMQGKIRRGSINVVAL